MNSESSSAGRKGGEEEMEKPDPGKPPLAKRFKKEMNLHVDIKQLKKSTSFSMSEDSEGKFHATLSSANTMPRASS